MAGKNGKVKEPISPVVIPDGVGLLPTEQDYTALIKAYPTMELPLINIIQQRLLAEKDVEIAGLKDQAKN